MCISDIFPLLNSWCHHTEVLYVWGSATQLPLLINVLLSYITTDQCMKIVWTNVQVLMIKPVKLSSVYFWTNGQNKRVMFCGWVVHPRGTVAEHVRYTMTQIYAALTQLNPALSPIGATARVKERRVEENELNCPFRKAIFEFTRRPKLSLELLILYHNIHLRGVDTHYHS